MAEELDPRLYYQTPGEAAAAGYASPVEAAIDKWAKQAKPGDRFDLYEATGIPVNKGIQLQYNGLNERGKATLETIQSAERENWRQTLREGGRTDAAGYIKRLTDVGFAPDIAAFMAAREIKGLRDQINELNPANRPNTIGAMANGTPIFGFGPDGNPVTDPNGSIYSTTNSQDAVARYQSGQAPISGPKAPPGIKPNLPTQATSSAAVTATPFFSASANAGRPAGSTTTANPFLPGTPEFAAFGERESAYNLLYQQMAAYGLQSLVEPLRNLVVEGVSPSEFTIRLRDTAAYKQRFGANQARINKGLRALSEAEYIGLEDQYQNVMRRYGLPASFYTRGELGRQEGFEKFIAGDVSPVELEDRVQTAYNRVINANPEVSIALRTFYPGITNGDILAYALDPERSLNEINRKITAAEIGGAAVQAGLTTNESDAEYLARYGITKEQAQQGYRTISGYLPTAQKLSSIYGNQVTGGAYTQASAEREIFGTPGAAEEERKRRQLTSLEEAAFSGRSGLTGGALARDRAGSF